MTFTPNIPQTGQSLGQTRDAVRNNFTDYNMEATDGDLVVEDLYDIYP